MTTALYARVSTDDQSAGMQLDDLHAISRARHWENVKEYVDEGISGSKKERPALDRLIADVKVGRIERIVVWKFDRMARSALHLLEILDLCRDYNVQFVSHHESLDTGTAMGRAMLTIFGAIAELERDTIRTRVKAGIARAKKEGRPHGRPKVIYDRKIAEEMRRNGISIRAISDAMRVSQTVIHRDLRYFNER